MKRWEYALVRFGIVSEQVQTGAMGTAFE
jgi:hypothetical protein